ncbi:N-formylglutamate amidohydrolase [Pseudoalteromonas fenneropenaei]|uniref:N-formylglutamate amidohydrolase n=1 Tax=Pseudoalteromonas fenneropenaei TaxID=1737459 RepID=A0ABV7CJA7_9GAMM
MRETVFTVYSPPAEGEQLPLVFDSPHSSAAFPQSDYVLNVGEAVLKTGWDAYIDELWQPAVKLGATLLAAGFSRMYIDPNRALDDIDPELLNGVWPMALNPTKYSERGMGLIRRFALPNQAMYGKALTAEEIAHRINTYYAPYHAALSTQLDTAKQQFGAVWHVDCHSMKSTGNAMNIDAGDKRADIVIGDRMGQSANPEFTQVVADAFIHLGYQVALNYPYQGGQIISQYGQPKAQCHSIQIEINRALYMDEAQFSKHSGFTLLQADLLRVSEAIRGYIREQLAL